MPATAFSAGADHNKAHILTTLQTVWLPQGIALEVASGGVLVTCGPYLEDGVPTSPGDLAFDASLRTDNPAWGGCGQPDNPPP